MEDIKDLNILSETPVTYSAIATNFKKYKSVKDKVASFSTNGNLLRIKKGLYIVSPKITKSPVSLELIANNLYGPSYVSLETALSYYSLIPERTYSIRSMSLKRAKTFSTPLGNFEYVKTPKLYFQIGIKQIIKNNIAFLIATPEKALCDIIFSSSMLRLQSVKAVRQYLSENLRMDLLDLNKFDISVVKEILQTGIKKTEFSNLLRAIEYER
ncbi:MAG: hypothetical protein FWF32_04130 [Endomicrobia bacterium]|nr:hypothetical protein [Endomicrobiia bacterium]